MRALPEIAGRSSQLNDSSAMRHAQMETTINRIKRTSPSLHLLIIIVIMALAFIGYVAVIASGQLRGYDASKLAAGRDLALFLPIIGVFFWLTRRQRFRGEMLPMTAAIFLF